ncbi:MAG: four helix bundle protein [bacterium]
MKKSAVSVPSNIVEGCVRESSSEYLRFLDIIYASLKELHYQILLADSLGYIKEGDLKDCEIKLEEIKKILTDLFRSLKKH